MSGLPARLVHRAFPFHFALDLQGRFVQVGPSLARLCPAAVPGAPAAQALTVRSPQGLPLEGPADGESGLVLLEVDTSPKGLLLRGEVVVDGDLRWFLGSPWVTDLGDLGPLGLTLADFAGHDPVADLLVLLQAQRSSQADVERLVERMREAAAEQARATAQEHRLAAELRALPDLALRLAADGTLLAVRPAREGEMADASADLIGRSAYEAFPWLAPGLKDAVERALEGPHVQQLTARHDVEGEPRHYDVRVMGSEADQALVLVRDVSEVRAMQEQLAHRAFHDPLTGLANRSLFADRVEHALAGIARSGATPVLLLLDLDAFKGINDVHGHLVGDAVLTAVGQRLAATVRPEDTVARLGGDEFAVLVGDGGVEEGERVARRLLDRVGRPVRTDQGVVSVGVSIGVACASADDDLVSLLRHGDTALYAAKQAGRQQSSTYDDAMRQQLRDRSALEADLRRAMATNELVLHHQPIRDLTTGAVYGWEALLRWEHPVLGLLCPEQFLPLAEELGLMQRMSARVLRRATRDAQHLGGLMHVNLSPSQLADPTLVDVVGEALHASGLPGSRLVLELTEMALISDPQDVASTMHQLRGLEVGMSLDDFGTGFSSLSRLHALPFTELKLDRSFLGTLGDEGRDAVAEAILTLGAALGLTVVAEGVESRAQADRVRELGCRYGQGFHLGRPAPAP